MMNLFNRWHYPTALAGRDLRLDFLRGYCVVVMIIDHVGLFPAWTIGLTGNVRLWVSAAEGFVLISGAVMGMVYPRMIAQRGWPWAINHVTRRAAGLYVLTVVGQIIFNTGDFLLRVTRGHPANVPDDYFQLIQEAIFQSRMAPTYLWLLPLYILFMLWGLLVLYALSRGQWRWVLVASVGLYYAARLDPVAFTAVQTFFRFPVWQIIFTIGLLAGYYSGPLKNWWLRLPARAWRSAALIGSGLGLLLLGYQVSYHGVWADIEWLRFDAPLFQQPQLGLGRIVAALLVFAACFELLTVCWLPLRRVLGGLLLPLGQHALTAFLLHSIAVYCVQRLPGWPFPDHDYTAMGFIHLAIVLAVWAATLAVVHMRSRWSQLRVARATLTARAN
jgi:hypothetical protein